MKTYSNSDSGDHSSPVHLWRRAASGGAASPARRGARNRRRRCRRGWRHASVRQSAPTHGLSGLGARRAFKRRNALTDGDHESGQHRRKTAPRGSSLGVPDASQDWSGYASATGGAPDANPRHCLEGAGAALRPISQNDRSSKKGFYRHHCRSSRARRIHVGDCTGGDPATYVLIRPISEAAARVSTRGLGESSSNFGSGAADLRESDRGSPTTHTWHAVSNPRMRNCSTVANRADTLTSAPVANNRTSSAGKPAEITKRACRP